jgi:hypothetical protein
MTPHKWKIPSQCLGLIIYSSTQCFVIFRNNWGDRTQLEHFSKLTTTEFLRQIAFPQRDRVLRFSNHHNKYGLEGEGGFFSSTTP